MLDNQGLPPLQAKVPAQSRLSFQSRASNLTFCGACARSLATIALQAKSVAEFESERSQTPSTLMPSFGSKALGRWMVTCLLPLPPTAGSSCTRGVTPPGLGAPPRFLGFWVLCWLKIFFHGTPSFFAYSKAVKKREQSTPAGKAKDPPMAGAYLG